MSKTADRVFRALPEEPGKWTTVEAVVEYTGLTRETVRKHLKALNDAGRARVEVGDDDTWWRQWTDDDVVASDVPEELTEEAPESPVEASDPPVGRDGPEEPRSGGSDEISAVLGMLQAQRPSVMEALAEATRPVTATCTHPGCGKEVTKTGRTWTHTDADVSHKATTRVHYQRKGRTGNCTHKMPNGNLCGLPVHTEGRTWTHGFDVADRDHEATTKRQRQRNTPNAIGWRKGELSDAIVAYMQGRPDTEFTPGEVAKALGAHNQSSVAYAMDKLAGAGVLKATNLRPYRYQAE